MRLFGEHLAELWLSKCFHVDLAEVAEAGFVVFDPTREQIEKHLGPIFGDGHNINLGDGRDFMYRALDLMAESLKLPLDLAAPPDGKKLVTIAKVGEGDLMNVHWMGYYPYGIDGGESGWYAIPQMWISESERVTLLRIAFGDRLGDRLIEIAELSDPGEGARLRRLWGGQ